MIERSYQMTRSLDYTAKCKRSTPYQSAVAVLLRCRCTADVNAASAMLHASLFVSPSCIRVFEPSAPSARTLWHPGWVRPSVGKGHCQVVGRCLRIPAFHVPVEQGWLWSWQEEVDWVNLGKCKRLVDLCAVKMSCRRWDNFWL